jgi:hypothetical protein
MSDEFLAPCHVSPNYMVSTHGRVKSLSRVVKNKFSSRAIEESFLNPILHKSTGYFVVKIENRQHLVHRLVLSAFVTPMPRTMHACHWDGNKQNNALSNLRWDTAYGNASDKKRHGTIRTGEDVNGAKLTADDVRSIRADARQRKQIATDYGVTPEAISCVVLRKTWRHV